MDGWIVRLDGQNQRQATQSFDPGTHTYKRIRNTFVVGKLDY